MGRAAACGAVLVLSWFIVGAPSASCATPSTGRVLDPGAPWPRYEVQRLPLPAGVRGVPLELLEKGDLDGDGRPDLLAVWCGGGRSTVAVYGSSAPGWEHRDSDPFSPPRVILAVDGEIAFAAVCDINRDGSPDVVLADRDHAELLWFTPGSSRTPPLSSVPLPGTVTALAALDWGRRDLVSEPVAGVATPSGPALVLFARTPPEDAVLPVHTLALPAAARALACGDLDGDGWWNVAVADGNGLSVVRRAGELDDQVRLETVTGTGDGVWWVAVLRFPGLGRDETAVLPSGAGIALLDIGAGIRREPAGGTSWDAAPASFVTVAWEGAGRGPALVVPRPDGLELTGAMAIDERSWRGTATASLVLGAEPVSVLPARWNGDGPEDLAVALRGSSSPLLLLTQPRATYTITTSADHDDGTCSAADCTLREAINAANASAGPDLIDTSGPSVFSIGSTLPTVDDTTTFDLNGQGYWYIDGSSATGGTSGLWIRGDSCAVHKPVLRRHATDSSGNKGVGLLLLGTSNTVVDGLIAENNGAYGVQLFNADHCTVSGSSSRNGSHGFYVYRSTGDPSSGNHLDPVAASGNSGHGILIQNAQDNEIGGLSSSSGAVLDGNGGDGIRVEGATATGNFLTNVRATDDSSRPNTNGVTLEASGNVSITGGAFSGNRGFGIDIQNTAAGVGIRDSRIGYLMDGTAAGNATDGIRIHQSSNVTISRCVISNNGWNGIEIVANTGQPATGNVIKGSLIGSDPGGTSAAGNGFYGINIDWGSGNTVGLSGTLSRNLIVANGSGGIRIYGQPATGNVVQNTTIGVTAGGLPIPNSGHGILVEDAPDNVIGPDNVIAYNTGTKGEGIVIRGNTATGVNCSGNSIHDNAGLGIDLGADGVTYPDDGDTDEGPNHLLNQPEIVVAETCGGHTWILGQLRCAASSLPLTITLFRNQACDASSMGEGETAIGDPVTITAPSGGTVHFRQEIPWFGAGTFATGMTKDPFGSTSEFSNCRAVTDGRPGDASADCLLMADDLAEIVRAATDPGYAPPGDPDSNGSGAADPLDLVADLIKIYW